MAFGFPCCISDEISYQQNKFLYCMSQKDIASPKSFFFIFFFFFFFELVTHLLYSKERKKGIIKQLSYTIVAHTHNVYTSSIKY